LEDAYIGAYVIVGKVVYAGLDGEGNLHLVLKNSSQTWAELAVRYLKSVENRVVKVAVSLWNAKDKREGQTRILKCTRTEEGGGVK